MTDFIPFGITFIAGASYGFTTVLVGQPLDTIKTRMQGMPSTAKRSMMVVGKELFYREGVRGLYRGGLPLLLGGSLMRSAQFGVSGKARDVLRSSNLPQHMIWGMFDYQVVLAGLAGGLGRALVEIPTDFFKVRQQVENKYTLKSILDGAGVTMARNSLLYTSFMVYVDLSKQLCSNGYVPKVFMVEDGSGLSPFSKGAICANLAWLTCWPMDVIKTQRQSGNYPSTVSSYTLLKENFVSGKLLRGLVPGLIRSTISNGSSMVVYEYVHVHLSQIAGVSRRDMT